MKLSEKITELRKKNGWSQEELAFRLGISRQSVSKWESGAALPEMEKIVQLAELFDVSCDYLMREQLTSADLPKKASVVTAIEEPSVLPDDDGFAVDVEPTPVNDKVDITEIIARMRKAAVLNAIGGMLCVLCPVLLIILAARADVGLVSDGVAVGVGLSVLLVLVAIGVVLFVLASRFRFESEGDASVRAAIKNWVNVNTRFHVAIIAVAAALCVISAVPLFVAIATDAENAIAVCNAVACLLAIVSVGVALFVYAGVIKESVARMLACNELSAKQQQKKQLFDNISSLYWALALAVYLIWSFLSQGWGYTWIVWPIAGVVWAVVSAVLKFFNVKDDDE